MDKMKKIANLKDYLSKIKDGEKVYDFLTGITDETSKGKYAFSENLYANVVSYETKDSDNFDGTFESHRDFIDLHVLIAGEEKMFYGNSTGMTITKEYDETGDYELLKGDKYYAVECGEMQGVEFPVKEPHMAGYTGKHSQKILKAIVKIRYSH